MPARTLDRFSAVRFQGQQLQQTVYTGSRLLIRPLAETDAIIDALRAAADEHELDIDVNEVDERLVAIAREAGIGPDEPQPLILRVELLPRWDSGPVSPPDAWPVLQSYRNRFAADTPERAAVQLEHLLTSHTERPATVRRGASPGIPYWQVAGRAGNPYWQVAGADRQPVLARPPERATRQVPYWQAADTTAPRLAGGDELASYAVTGLRRPDTGRLGRTRTRALSRTSGWRIAAGR